MAKPKPSDKPVTVTISIPRELADSCVSMSDDPREFKWGPFIRTQIRRHIERNAPKQRLRNFSNNNKSQS